MSLETMKHRLEWLGGAEQEDRMIKEKLRSLQDALYYSYQGAKISNYHTGEEARALINPVSETQDYDTKLFSVENKHKYKVGSLFNWKNTHSTWIVFLQDRTELAYFRGRIRRCDHKVRWVDAEKKLNETPISVIGPGTNELRTSSSMQAKAAEDFPNAKLIMLVPDTAKHRAYFHRYQILLLEGLTYQVENFDLLSMPGVIQMTAIEYYGNSITEDFKENIVNAFNVLPIVEEPLSSYPIRGDIVIQALKWSTYVCDFQNVKRWFIKENEEWRTGLEKFPVEYEKGDNTVNPIRIRWSHYKTGRFTLCCELDDGQVFELIVVVESLM